MLPRDSAGVPLTNIGTVWPPWDTLMFVLMAVPTLVNWGGAIMLAVLAIWTPLRGEYC